MPNAWVSFVKEFSDKKKMKYNDAMKSAECKEAYQKQKPKSMDETSKEMVKTPKMKMPKKVQTETIQSPLKSFEPPPDTIVEAKVRRPRMKKVKEVLDKLM